MYKGIYIYVRYISMCICTCVWSHWICDDRFHSAVVM